MRSTTILTTSIPPTMVKEVDRWAKKQHMTRSELVREALRQYMRDVRIDYVIRVAEEERRAGKLKVLPPGGLGDLIGA